LHVPGLVRAMHRQLIRQAGDADDLPQQRFQMNMRFDSGVLEE
jgi:hypothetical protein